MGSDKLTPCIQVKNVNKEFEYWTERKSSFKTFLVDALKGNFDLGVKHKFTALEEISFEIFPGEFVGIMGRNGAGKSTLLKLICGIYRPTSGDIVVNAQIAPLIELGAGFDGDLSGHENIFLNAAILGLGKKATEAVLEKIIEFSELGDKIYMPVKKYSSGMLVRLGFAIAVHIPSPILLIDEVLAVGDMGFQEKCVQKIKSLHQEGRTIILITHSPDAVKLVCQRCIVIDQRKKVYDGPVSEGVDVYVKSVHTH